MRSLRYACPSCIDRTFDMDRVLISTVMVIVLSGCLKSGRTFDDDASSELVRFSTDSIPTYELEGNSFTNSDSLAQPSRMSVGLKYIFVGDTKATRSILVFDRRTGDFVTSVGNRGKGPREISYLWSMDIKPGHDTGWAFDFSPRTINAFSSDSMTDQRIVLRGEGSPMSPVWIKGDTIASVGMYSTGRLALYAPDGSFTRLIGPEPPGDPDIPVAVRQHAFQASLQTNSEGDRIVAASINTDRLEIFDTKGLLQTIRGPKFHEPLYTVHGNEEGDSWLSIDNETIQGYVSTAVTDDFIFALYSGRSMGWVRSNGWWSPPGRRVIVFSWKAEPIAVLELEDGALKIGVSHDGKELYALYRRPVPMILRYSVPDLQ